MLTTGDGIALAALFLSAWGTTQAFFKFKIESKTQGTDKGNNGNGNGYVRREVCAVTHAGIEKELARINTKLDHLIERNE